MKLPRSYYNTLSFIGTVVAAISLFMIIFGAIVGYFFEASNAYLGLFTYIILPAIMITGLILIPVGMLIDVKRRKKEKEYLKKKWPVIDLNISRYRNAILIFGVGTLFLLLLSGIGSYEAFQYTESVEFCGTVCHDVMDPVYTAYQESPHAQVACVDCHVGSGADWYVRSKMSGLRQVYAVITDDFSRPIPTPIENLRPARETCEECHWPQKFYSRQLRNTKHYLTDSVNTEWNISLQMKIGPAHSAYGLTEGIHWHINPDVKIEYVSLREAREMIPYVKYTNMKTGEVTIYNDEELTLDAETIASKESREMDCIDCHNRPSHEYKTPQEFIDLAITAGKIPDDLPYIKKVAMDLFVDPYSHTDSAIATIKEYTANYYQENLPEIWRTRQNDIQMAINGIIDGFSQNIFPEMQASWDVYPNFIGHKTYNGCFRCHDDRHKSDDGQVIRKDCDICHTIVAQGEQGQEEYAAVHEDLEFVHPKKLKEGWEEDLCTDCHRYLYL